MRLTDIPTFKDGDVVHCVVESPASSATKLKYNPELGAFELGRSLGKGLTYPYDWGFIPSTLADDGDPLDAMLIHDVPTTAGLVVPARIVGALLVEQKVKGEPAERNDRIFAVPVQPHGDDGLADVDGISRRLRKELEEFFESDAELEDKKLKFLGWQDRESARQLIAQAQRRYRKRRRRKGKR